jgi:hypothetical protein
MTMEFEGNLLVERAHTRRWVSIIAVIIPVAAIVLLAAWFIRVYVAPATVLVPNPPMIVAEPPAPPAVSQRAETAAPQPPAAMAETATAPPASDRPASTLPMFATLAVPPSLGSAPPAPAYADPVQDATPAAPSIMVDEPVALDSGEPIAGPVPLPRAKPHGRVALLASSIPLPRPRPAEIALPPDDLPVVDRHAID